MIIIKFINSRTRQKITIFVIVNISSNKYIYTHLIILKPFRNLSLCCFLTGNADDQDTELQKNLQLSPVCSRSSVPKQKFRPYFNPVFNCLNLNPATSSTATQESVESSGLWTTEERCSYCLPVTLLLVIPGAATGTNVQPFCG